MIFQTVSKSFFRVNRASKNSLCTAIPRFQKPEICPNRINIDTGAYATGILTSPTIQDEQMFAI
jgi:hypothetical protein